MMDPMMVMRMLWFITALGCMRLGSKALGFDYFSKHKDIMKIIDIVFGVAGVLSMISFFMA